GERQIDFNAGATGGMDATFPMVMTKQIDVGYSILPNQLDSVAKGDIRVLFPGDDVKSQRAISGRAIIASADFVKNHRATLVKFMRVLDGCIDWAYAHEDESSKMYAALNKVEAPTAAKALAFYKRSTLAFGPIAGGAEVEKQSLDENFIGPRPRQDQVKDLVDIVYKREK